jgi:hypothetical protein
VEFWIAEFIVYVPKLALNVTVLINQIGPQIEGEGDTIYLLDKLLKL